MLTSIPFLIGCFIFLKVVATTLLESFSIFEILLFHFLLFTIKESFTVDQDCPDAKIGFNLGYEPGSYQISNVKLVRIK